MLKHVTVRLLSLAYPLAFGHYGQKGCSETLNGTPERAGSFEGPSLMKPMLLIVDDEKTQREGLRAVLEDHYEVYIADSAASAIELLESDSFDVLLTDFRMPGEDGLKLIKRAKSLAQPPVCILMTAFGSEETAVQAIKEGADDYLPKGSMLIDDLEKKIQRSLKLRRLEEENIVLKQQLGKRFQTSNIVGESPAMRGVFDMVEQVAPTNATVLILGESGTGKELIAKAIHQSSHRAHHAMVTVHCAGLSRRFWRVSFLVTRRALLPVHMNEGSVVLRKPMVALCFWMRSAKLTFPRRSNCCVFSENVPLKESGPPKR